MADLNELFSLETTQRVVLEHPATFEPLLNDKGDEMAVFLWGQDSAPMRAVEKMISNDMLERASRARGGRFKMDATSTERYTRQRFLARLDGWENFVMNGKPFVYDDKAKAAIFDDPKFGGLRRQVELAASDDLNFLATSSDETTSPKT